MKKRLLSILMALALCLSLLPTVALADEGDVEYLYCDENGENWQTGIKKAGEYTVITLDYKARNFTAGWYVVNSDLDLDECGLAVEGDVHFILADNCSLSLGCIYVNSGNSLTIYAQSTDEDTMGRLVAQHESESVGIGGHEHGGTITINGGKINASGMCGAGIGGGGGSFAGNGGIVTINGGIVTATSTYGAGIGGGGRPGSSGDGGVITINGGTVIATSTYGAGIGGGNHGDGNGGDGGKITINGGDVKATSTYGAGIGGGNGRFHGGNGGTVTINGGDVTACSGTSDVVSTSAGIGGGSGNDQVGSGADVTITGGTVTASTTNPYIAAIGCGDGDTGPYGTPGTLIITGGNITPPAKYYEYDAIAGIKPEGDSNLVAFGNLTLPVDLTIPEGKTLTIPSGASLTIPEGKTLINKGTIINNGTLTNNGTLYVDGALSGTVSGAGSVYYHLALTNCTATGSSSLVTYDGKTYATAGTHVTLAATLSDNQLVTSWQVPGVTGIPTASSYVIPDMPAHRVTATARLANALTIDTQPTGGTITYGETTTLSVAVSKHDNAEGTLAFKWYEGSTAIDGADSASYTTPADLVVGDHTYHCVITCGTYTVTSSTATVTVNPLAEATPIISIDYENETLTGFVSGSKYSIDGEEVTTGDGKLSVVDYIGSNINIVTKASDSNHADSTAQALNIPARPAAPSPTVKSKTSGSVTLEEIPGAQYSMDGGATWQDSPEFTGLSAGTEYSFVARYGATESSFASPTSAELNVTTSAVSSGGGSSTPTYPPTVTQPDNGSVTVSPKSPKKGDTVTITPKPDAGYTVEQILVTDKNGNAVEVTNNGDGTYSFTQPAGKVNVTVTFMDDNTMLNFFVDVFPGDYYYDAVLWAAENGITGGVDDTHFAPNAPCTRAQIVTFLWRAAGSPEPENVSSFADVSADSYYAKAVAWAVENGITTGTGDGMFSPNATCTRAQAMAFIWRSQKSVATDGVNPFTDVAADAYYADAVLWAVANGITNGTSDTTFSPNNDCTRAQIVTFLYRFFVK